MLSSRLSLINDAVGPAVMRSHVTAQKIPLIGIVLFIHPV